MFKIAAQELQALIATHQLAESIEQALRDQCQIGRVLLFNSLPTGDGLLASVLLRLDVALQKTGTNAFTISLQRGLQVA